MVYVEVSFDYSALEIVRAMDAESYKALRLKFPYLKLEEVKEVYLSISSLFLDLKEVAELADAGIHATVRKIKGLHYPNPLGNTEKNSVVITNVSVPNNALFEVSTVHWLEDACTQDLQEHLNDGWRIFALCPSNDSRRPTYILGKK